VAYEAATSSDVDGHRAVVDSDRAGENGGDDDGLRVRPARAAVEGIGEQKWTAPDGTRVVSSYEFDL
jgi:hypothetical protein